MKFAGGLCVMILFGFPWEGRFKTQLFWSGLVSQENSLQTSKPSDLEIVLERSFAAPRDAVFAALTQAEHLSQWIKSKRMTLATCEVDLRAGGTFRYVFQRPSGARIEVRGLYKAVDPPRRFEYTESYDFSPLIVQVSTTLETKNGKTLFKQRLAYPSKQERDDDFEGVATSAADAYAELERYLERIKK